MPNSREIDNALAAKLGSDATLRALMPNGVFWDVAPVDCTQVVILSFVDEKDEHEHQKRAIEDTVYEVKVIERSTVTTSNIDAACGRIDELLDGGTLTAPGYTLMVMYRERRRRSTVRDEASLEIRWFEEAAQYRVMMSVD